jgi:hypothetical protein
MEDVLVKVIGELGFPVAVAAFVLVRLNGRLAKLIDRIGDLVTLLHTTAQSIRAMNEHIERIERMGEKRRSL